MCEVCGGFGKILLQDTVDGDTAASRTFRFARCNCRPPNIQVGPRIIVLDGLSIISGKDEEWAAMWAEALR